MNIRVKQVTRPIFLAMILLGLVSFTGIADAEESNPQTGELTVPWNEFKHLLNLDDDQVVRIHSRYI